jgi:hypothetical protein
VKPSEAKKLEEITIEGMADEFIEHSLPLTVGDAQRHDMKMAFIAGVSTLAYFQRRLQREAPTRTEPILAALEAELNELIPRYSAPAN